MQPAPAGSSPPFYSVFGEKNVRTRVTKDGRSWMRRTQTALRSLPIGWNFSSQTKSLSGQWNTWKRFEAILKVSSTLIQSNILIWEVCCKVVSLAQSLSILPANQRAAVQDSLLRLFFILGMRSDFMWCKLVLDDVIIVHPTCFAMFKSLTWSLIRRVFHAWRSYTYGLDSIPLGESLGRAGTSWVLEFFSGRGKLLALWGGTGVRPLGKRERGLPVPLKGACGQPWKRTSCLTLVGFLATRSGECRFSSG